MFHDVRWTAQKIAQRLQAIEPLVYRRSQPLPPFRFARLEGPLDPPPVAPGLDDSGWEIVYPRTYWGDWEMDFILRTAFQVPPDWPADAPIGLYLPLGVAGSFSHPEALVYIDGQPYAGCDRHHQEIRLPDICRGGAVHHLALHGWTGHHPGDEARVYMRECAVVQIDPPVRALTALTRVALGTVGVLEDTNPARDRLLNALNAAYKALDTREPLGGDAFYASVPAALAALQGGIAGAGAPMEVDLVAAGHAHIDVAWLWTLGQTRRKAGRTFHTVLRLMEQFPAYQFTQSQPQLYDFVRQDYPALFEEIKTRVAGGRWEALGGMWVEADCNLSGPESLARQFLLGRTFFREHFGEGADSPVLWLPDVFGYAWALPQLIRQAGLEYFFTIKIGWNQYNRLPYDSFWWQGLDGTRVLTHFSTTPEGPNIDNRATYNAAATPRDIFGTWLNLQHKESQRTLLMSYGYGDGGGGPTREMLENIGALESFPAMPQTRPGRVIDFFRQLEAESGDRLPTWDGELYLEYHRGTYTTQSRNKRANRKSEFLLHDAECLAAMASLIDPDYRYPGAAFRKAWELVCLNQFHDIIPGSSITPVYTESQEQYQEVYRMGVEARDEALAAVARVTGGDLLLANTTSFSRDDLTFWPEPIPADHYLARPDGEAVPVQIVEDGMWIAPGELPPLSVIPLQLVAGQPPAVTNGLIARPDLLENDFLRVELNAAGDITRLYDKVNRREVLPVGAVANQFQLFEDRPLNYDAWDIDIFYDDRMWLAGPAESIAVAETGPLRATLEVRRRIGDSTCVQRISLAYNSPRLDFSTTVDWQERRTLLKVAFPVEVLAPVATYEIQWGSVQRPTHANTSWDWARFETVAQKWVDLSEGGYGVSLLNDCKYGHDIHANVIRLTLLRGTVEPDPEADLGEHTFVYSLFPHSGGWDERTIAAAYALNDPIVVIRGAESPGTAPSAVPSLLAVEQANVVIETIKRAEDGRGLIVRLYESQRWRGPVTLRSGFPVVAVWRTNLLEEDQEEIPVTEEGAVVLSLRPFEIVTLRLLPDGYNGA